MNPIESFLTWRSLPGGDLALGAAFFTSGAFAEELARTPRMTEGPFYPSKRPLDSDNDLILINKSITPAIRTIPRFAPSSAGDLPASVVMTSSDRFDANFQGACCF